MNHRLFTGQEIAGKNGSFIKYSSDYQELIHIPGCDNLCFAIRIGIQEGFREAGFGHVIPFEFIHVQDAIVIFDVINLLLFVGAPEVSITPFPVVMVELHAFADLANGR
jgi:hypothetical protein